MRVTIEQTAVWRSMDDYNGNREPVAVVTSEAAAWAVFNLLNPPAVVLSNGCVKRSGPFPAIGTLYSWSERPDLAEDIQTEAQRREEDSRWFANVNWANVERMVEASKDLQADIEWRNEQEGKNR